MVGGAEDNGGAVTGSPPKQPVFQPSEWHTHAYEPQARHMSHASTAGERWRVWDRWERPAWDMLTWEESQVI